MSKAGSKETVWLFVILIISRITLNGTLVFVESASQSAAIASAICVFLSALFVYVNAYLFENKSFDIVANNVYGRYLKKVIYLLLIVLTVINASDRLNIFSQAIGKYILDDSPKTFIIGIFSIVTFVGAYIGLEALARFSYLAGVMVMIFIGIIIVSCFGETHALNLFPLLNKGVFKGTFNGIYMFSDIIYFYFIAKDVDFSDSYKKSFLKTIIKSGAVIFLITLFFSLCVPYPASKNFVFPLYRLASLANSSVLIQRLDGLVFLIWIFSGFISVSALLYISSNLFGEMSDMSDSHAILPIMSFIIFLLTISNTLCNNFINGTLSLFLIVFLPFTGIIFKIKSRGKNNV